MMEMLERAVKYRPILINTRRARLARRALFLVRRAGDMLYGFRTKLATAAVILLAVLLALHVVFGANGMIVYQKKRSEYRILQKDVEQLQKENDALSQRIKALKTDPAAIEKEAREQLHYARPGEVIYLNPRQPNPNAPPPNASAKK
jgi:cell division protein FtsB